MGSCQKEESLLVDGPIIVGAGPSGLAASACLSNNGVPSLILEKCDCIASLWQYKSYDILKLHLPKKFCQLPYLNFPKHFPKYPTKQQFISYMESYASHFSIHPEFNQEVRRAVFDQSCGVWRVYSQDCEYVSQWLIVATGENAEPVMPQIHGLEKFHGPIKHTSLYRSGSEFENQKVLVVGCGNSGMEISFDLCRNNANPHLVVRDTVHVLPREMFCLPTFGIAMVLLRWLPVSLVDKLLLLVANFTLGNTARYGLPRPGTGPIELKNVTGKSPVLDVGAFSMIKSGKIKVRPGLKEIKRDGAEFVDGEAVQFDAIVLATGYRSNVPNWLKDMLTVHVQMILDNIHLRKLFIPRFEELLLGSDFFTKEGMPKKPFPNGWKGENGLYTVGFSRRGLFGSSSDAVKVAGDIAEHWRKIKDCNNGVIFNQS